VNKTPNLLAHFDIFVKKDLMAMYLNGRQLTCWKIPQALKMDYGVVAYGQVLYHTDAEFQELNMKTNSYSHRTGQFEYVENTPATDTRVWDAVGHGSGSIGPTPSMGGMQPIDTSLCY
jgi:hypothetical protein